MAIKDSKIRVTFVTDKETKARLEAIVNARKRSGRKATVSSLLNELAQEHVSACDLFKATSV